MNKITIVFIGLSCLVLGGLRSFASDVPIPGYSYSVTDIQSQGLNSQALFSSMSTSWMDLKHSVCSNRAYIWSYDLHRKYGLNTGTIFVFFGEKVWERQKKSYWYHAATYIVENGKELVLEGSYPDEVFKPLTVVEWMDNEMEGRVDASRCVELKKSEDQDLTQLFYYHSFLPSNRAHGKDAYHCYYRKVPGYIPYPETVAELELGVEESGEKIDYQLKSYDQGILYQACLDAFSRRGSRRGSANGFCGQYF